MRAAAGLASALVLAVLACGCGTHHGPTGPAAAQVLHVRVRYLGQPPSTEDEWVELRGPRFHMRQGGRWWTYDGRRYETGSPATGVTLRVGSPRYMGDLLRLGAVQAVRAYYAGRRSAHRGVTLAPLAGGRQGFVVRSAGQLVASVRVVGELTSREADRQRLFAVDTRRATASSVELPAGARSTLHVHAYWFGPRWRGLRAVVAVDDHLRAHDQQLHTVFYEPPGARGHSSAYAGSPTPRGEVQVVSIARGSWLAGRKLATTLGHPGGGLTEPVWPRRRITLVAGPPATVILFRYRNPDGTYVPGFYVETSTTLVSVGGTGRTLGEVAGLARLLRPAG